MSSNGTASTLLPSFVQPSSPASAAASSPPLPSVTPSAVPSAAPAPSSTAAPSNPPSSAEPPSSQAPPPSPTPVPVSSPLPASSNPPPASSPPPPQSSVAPPTSSPPPPISTRIVTAPSAPPSATEVLTSVVVVTPSASVPGETPNVVTITLVSTPSQRSQQSNAVTSNSANPSSTGPTNLQIPQKENAGGLSTGGKTAIAVVIPVVAVTLLVLGAILFWRKRKQRKSNEDERRKEVEEYGFNPNHDPTLPAVGMQTEMAEDSSGYRGWGNTATNSNRKASTTLTSGMTYSDSNSNPGGYASPSSPTHGAYSDANSNDPLVNGRRETLDSDGIAALGTAPTSTNNQTGVHRGPSNASSSYSAANHSDNSGEYPGMPMNNPQEYYEQGYGSYQDGPFGGSNAYGAGQQPVIRDVSARRNTRIENPSVFPQQGNSGVATNF